MALGWRMSQRVGQSLLRSQVVRSRPSLLVRIPKHKRSYATDETLSNPKSGRQKYRWLGAACVFAVGAVAYVWDLNSFSIHETNANYTLTREEVAKHNTKESCWVIVDGNVYDVTNFIQKHPGGAKAILRKAGKDATREFQLIHPEGTLKENGFIPIGTVAPLSESECSYPKVTLPSLEAMLSLKDFEVTAQRALSPEAWAYYHSASDDMISKQFNNEIFQRVLFRPRVFIDVDAVDTDSSIAGYNTTLPVFICPTGQVKLAHPTGERGIADACAKEGIMQIISNHSSIAFQEIVSNPVDENQKFIFQLYVNEDRSISEEKLRQVVKTGRCHAVVLTLDAPAPGKRELDEKLKLQNDIFDPDDPFPSSGEAGIGQKMFAGTAPDVTWKDLKWLRSNLPPDMPILLKGIQTYEDAVLAANVSPRISGIVLSNHGGRAMDQSQPSLLILEEIRKNSPEVFDKLEVYIDGGIRRGSDVVKALCLGAKQVGIGRPALYGLAGYGEPGVQRTIQILRREIENAMKLLGAKSLEELGPHYLNTIQLDNLVVNGKDKIGNVDFEK